MNKYIAMSTLMLTAGNAEAHSHPSIDALTHAVEHMAINAQAWGSYWLPSLLGMGILALCVTLVQSKRARGAEGQRRAR